MSRGTLLVVDNATRATKKPKFLKKLLRELSSGGWTVVRAERSSEIDMEREYDAAILTGSPMLLTEPILMDCVAANTTALLQLQCPVLGICFGMQMIVVAYGGSLQRLPKFQSGPRKVRLDSSSILGAGMESSCVTEAYRDSVCRVPHGFKVVGVDDENHSTKAIERVGPPYRGGVLFHPEDGHTGLRTLKNFLRYVESSHVHV